MDADKLPGETVFKYFRYYAKPYPGVNLLPNGNFEYNRGKKMWTVPVAWTLDAGKNALSLERDDAGTGYYLQLGNTSASSVAAIYQKLEYILNDNYTLTAKVRMSTPDLKAKIKVSGIGGKDQIFKIPVSGDWTTIVVQNIVVGSNTAVISVESESEEGKVLDIDDIRFFKPDEMPTAVSVKPQTLFTGSPVWQIGQRDTLDFTGDGKFYFFDRNVGFGDSVTIQLNLMSRSLSNNVVLSRMPKSGKSGWSVQLLSGGGMAFNVGSVEDHKTVAAYNVFQVGKPFTLGCTFEKGEVKIYINDNLVKTETVDGYNLNDKTAAGRLGNTSAGFEAVGAVMVETETKESIVKATAFSGTVHGLTIYNQLVSKLR